MKWILLIASCFRENLGEASKKEMKGDGGKGIRISGLAQPRDLGKEGRAESAFPSQP